MSCRNLLTKPLIVNLVVYSASLFPTLDALVTKAGAIRRDHRYKEIRQGYGCKRWVGGGRRPVEMGKYR